MLHPEGGFYSAEDADSEGEEGKFYVWGAEEIRQVLGEDAELFKARYGISDGGNWEGTNILNITEEIPELAERGRARVLQFFDRLDTQLAENDFVAGDSYSMADITAMVLVDFARWIKILVPDDAANLARWYSVVSKRPSAAS